ncbi:unnamed protein product [Symbiodinium sp. CCMP2592]|nr:unnamed protein product [Symbiodinium sp. CCMP2592]
MVCNWLALFSCCAVLGQLIPEADVTTNGSEFEPQPELEGACDGGVLRLSPRRYEKRFVFLEDCLLVGVPGTILAAPLLFSKSGWLDGTLLFDHGDYAWNASCVAAVETLNISGDVVFRNCHSSLQGGAINIINPRGVAGHGRLVQHEGRLLFDNCSAEFSGGAIAAVQVEFHGLEVVFSNCRSSGGHGGAIRAQLGVHVTAHNVSFRGCEARSGAAIWSDAGLWLQGWSTIFEKCDCSGRRGNTAVVRVGFRGHLNIMNTQISTSVCFFGIDALGAFALRIDRGLFSWLRAGAILADFASDVNIQHASSQHTAMFLKARSVQTVRLQDVKVFCTPPAGTRCIDLGFWTDRAEIQLDGVQLFHRITSNLGGESVVLRFPVNAAWQPASANPVELTCYPGSYPEFKLTDEDHSEVKTVPKLKPRVDCSTLVPDGCCILVGGPGHILNNSEHRLDTECTTDWPCLCLDVFCSSCTVRSLMRVLSATCAPCQYGTMSPGFVNMPLEFHQIAWAARNVDRHWQKHSCNDCTLLAQSVDTTISCGRGSMEVPRGVMITVHRLSDYDDRATMVAWRCPNPSACPGQRYVLAMAEGLGKQCSPGYAQDIAGCTKCDHGYGKKVNDPFVCQQCPPMEFQWLLLILKHLGLFAVGMVSAQKPRRRTSVIFKIMVSFGTASNCVIQAVSSLPEYHMAKLSARRYVGLAEAMTSTTSLYNLHSYECLFRTRYFDSMRWAIIGVSPPLLLLLSCWIVTSVASRCGFPHREAVMIQATLVLGNSYMANVCANFMKPLSCFQMVHGVNGQEAPQFCSFSFMELCRTLQSQAIAGICNSACILIVPLYWLEMVRRSHNWQPQSRRQIMGFLVSGYRPAVEWWEVVPLLRKVLLLQVRVFFPPSYAGSTYLTLTLGVLFSSLVLHVAVWPYEDIYLNRIEGSTLGASVLALMLASLAVALEWFKHEDVTLRYLLALCIVLVVSTVILVVLLIRSLLEQVQNRIRRRDVSVELQSVASTK